MSAQLSVGDQRCLLFGVVGGGLGGEERWLQGGGGFS